MNEMILSQGNLPAHLQQAQQLGTDEFAAGVHQGQVLPVLSIRGKEFRLRYQGQERSLSETRSIDLLFVRARPHVSKRFYLKGYEGGSVDAPDCASTDGVKPDSGDNKQCDTCAMCPHNEFGSRITPSGKKGKACSDYKRMVVIPFVNGQPLAQPCILDVPATSLKAPQGHRGEELFLREFMGMLDRHNVPVQGVITTAAFTSAEYPQLHFKVKEYADEALYNMAMGARDDKEVTTALSAAMAEPTGPVEPAADPLPAEKPAHLQGVNHAGSNAPEAPRQADAAGNTDNANNTPDPAPQAEPQQAAPKEEKPAGDNADDAMMSEINDLLGGL